MFIRRAQLVIIISLLIVGIFCNNEDPVSSNNNNHNSTDSTVTDIDGNVYKTVKIGDQVWTAENIRTTRYRDSSSIPLITDQTEWSKLTTPGYCYINNISNADSIKKYGARYNWYTVNTKKLPPSGWHVPTYQEWEIMKNYLITHGYNWDGTTSGNKIAKSLASKSDWLKSDTLGTIGYDLDKNNKSNFSALPGGSRYSNGDFGGLGTYGHWWTASENDVSVAYCFFLIFSRDSLLRDGHLKGSAFAVRLVKDN